jgi:hypothetical protein
MKQVGHALIGTNQFDLAVAVSGGRKHSNQGA